MKTYKGRGIVLHTLKYGDSSMIVYLLTDVGGRRSYMVQGVRSRTGRGSKQALFQPVFPVEFEGLEPSQSQQMHRFKEVRAGFLLQRIPFDVRKSTMALFMAEVIYRLVRESERNETLFEFVWNSVAALDQMEEGVANFHLWFLAHLSRLLGFFPGNDYAEGCWFDIKEGLYTPIRPLHSLFLEPDAAALLDRMMQTSVTSLHTIALNRQQRVDFLNAMLTYFGYHLDNINAVQSVRILREVF
ncbi:MAG: DNA repair protein RecO [Alistipes sp.]|nr:DNA repair protein RecO [Alistipes sp.]